MASLSRKENGSFEIYIVVGGRRLKVRLGKIAKKDAIAIQSKVEHLVSRSISGLAPDDQVSAWLGSLQNDDKLFKRLVKLGLCDAREPEVQESEPESHTVQSVVERFLAFKEPMIAPSSYKKLEQCLDELEGCFGADINIDSITVGKASEFESWGRKKGFSEAHQRTVNRYAKQLFSFVVDHGWLSTNPFRKLKSTALAATVRHYVNPEDTERLLNACPSTQWKLLIGLARYAGVRVPSEAFAVTWSMIDWDKRAIRIPSKKTRRYSESRVCPIIPELMAILEKGWDEAPDGATTILTLSNANVRRKFPDIIKLAGLNAWEDIFQTLRRSCETHLVALGHPAHAVASWLGHSQKVSNDHYLMVTSEAFQQATIIKSESVERPLQKSGAKSGADKSGIEQKGSEILTSEDSERKTDVIESANQNIENAGKMQVVRAGIEPATHGFSVRETPNKNKGKTSSEPKAGRNAGHSEALPNNLAPFDRLLELVIERWPTLSESDRNRIVRIVRIVGGAE